MPCNCDYMQQTVEEDYLQTAAELLLWLGEIGVVHHEPARINRLKKDGAAYYAKDVHQVEDLCRVTKVLRESGQYDMIIRDHFKDKMARTFADWVDEHDEQDRRREEAEAADIRRTKIDKVVGELRKLPDDKIDQIIAIFQQVK